MLLYDIFKPLSECIIDGWILISIYNYHYYGQDASASIERLEEWLSLCFIVVCIVLCIVVYIPKFLRYALS